MNRFENKIGKRLVTDEDFREEARYYRRKLAVGCFKIACIICGIFLLILMATSKSVKAHDIDHVETNTKATHYLMEYYAPNKFGITQRYVRTVNIEMFDLVAGTARDHGINPAHLQAICLKEGVEFVGEHAFACSPTAVKLDEGAYGAFQIRAQYHGIPVEDAQHPYFSARWTAERMLRYHYKTNPYYAMGRHNGGGPIAQKYAGEVWQIAKTMTILRELTL